MKRSACLCDSREPPRSRKPEKRLDRQFQVLRLTNTPTAGISSRLRKNPGGKLLLNRGGVKKMFEKAVQDFES
jgi:hypothetical protein